MPEARFLDGLRDGLGLRRARRVDSENVIHLSFSGRGGAEALDLWIDAAIRSGDRQRRMVGLIAFDIPLDEPTASGDVSALAAALRRHVRRSDHVALADRGRILVAIGGLVDLADLRRIAERLSGVLWSSLRGGRMRLGLAVSPADGRTGAELIAAAGRDAASPRSPGLVPAP
jgi:hypothetical protein